MSPIIFHLISKGYIFKWEDGRRLSPDYVYKRFKRLVAQDPELPQDITLHGLRVSCCSILVADGLDLKVIQKWMRHKDVSTTAQIYARVKNTEIKHTISERMGNILKRK